VSTFWGEPHSKLYGLEAISLRYFNVYGPRQNSSSPYSGVISVFLNRAINRQKPIIHGDGEQSRDFIFVTDILNANLLAARQPGAAGKVFNIGSGCHTSIHQLWKEISHIASADLKPTYEPARKGDIRATVADTSLAKEQLGFQAKMTLEKGLAETYRWYKDRLKTEEETF